MAGARVWRDGGASSGGGGGVDANCPTAAAIACGRRERERTSESACVCERESECVCVRERECVCVRERVCVCVCEREREEPQPLTPKA